MLPDLRVVIIAVISTFLFTVSVGFYTSSRLMNEPRKARSDSLAALEDSPINRIALNWPEPVQQSSQLDLDFAVTLNGSRNPVRDVTNEVEAQADSRTSVARNTAVDAASPKQAAVPENIASPQADAPAAKETEPAPAEEPAHIQAVHNTLTVPSPEPTPPTSGVLLVTQGAEAIVAPAPLPVEPETRPLTIPAQRTEQQVSDAHASQSEPTEQPASIAAETKSDKSDNAADPEETGSISLPENNPPMPRAKPERTGPALKKAVITTKRAKKPIKVTQKRVRPRITPPKQEQVQFLFPFSFFNTQQPKQSAQTTTQAR